jgi:proline dehydrogenase
MMRAPREPMTIAQLKRSMDSRFKQVDKRFRRVDLEFRRLREEVRQQSEQTRRHFDVVAESLRDDLRLFAEAIRANSERLGDHEVRLRRLERTRQA